MGGLGDLAEGRGGATHLGEKGKEKLWRTKAGGSQEEPARRVEKHSS